MLHYYVDESYLRVGERWHCNMGGMLIPTHDVFEAEIALEACLKKISRRDPRLEAREEFKSSSFFREAPDELKLQAAGALAEVLSDFDIEVPISHAVIQEQKWVPFGEPFPPTLGVQLAARLNLIHALRDAAQDHTIQMIVDLGLSEAFRPVHDIHASPIRGIKAMLADGLTDALVTTPHVVRLLPPAFQESRESRLLQFSDLVVGLLLAEETGRLSPLKRSLLDRLAPVLPFVSVTSCNWGHPASADGVK